MFCYDIKNNVLCMESLTNHRLEEIHMFDLCTWMDRDLDLLQKNKMLKNVPLEKITCVHIYTRL